MKELKVSVLVPIYKVPEHLLKQCLDSLMKQTLRDIEFILVDDESPDNCGKICDEYAKIDSRFKVIHQKNKGLSGARNTAFKNANGKYIMFLDGDDYITENCLYDAYSKAVTTNVDVVLWNVIEKNKNLENRVVSIEGGDRIFDREGCLQLQKKVLDFNGQIAHVFAKLIRRDLLLEFNILHNEELKQGAEGIVFNVKLFQYARNAYYMNEFLNYYIYNGDSISHSHNEENYYLIVRCFQYIKEFLNEKGRKDLDIDIYTRMLYVIVTTGITGYFNPMYVEKYGVKKRKFLKFLNEPFVRECLKKGEVNRISTFRRILIFCAKHKFVNVFYVAGILRRFQYEKGLI